MFFVVVFFLATTYTAVVRSNSGDSFVDNRVFFVFVFFLTTKYAAVVRSDSGDSFVDN